MFQRSPNRSRTRLWLALVGALATCLVTAVSAVARPVTPDFPVHHKTAHHHAVTHH